MREALARSGNDFLVTEPRRKKPAPRAPWLSALIGVMRFLRGVANYPNRIAGALLVGLAVAIAINALELQTTRHPAPLFGRTAPLSQALPAAPPPMPMQARSQAPSQASSQPSSQVSHQTLSPALGSAPAPAAPAHVETPAPPAPTMPAAPTDPLGQFIRQGEATPAARRIIPLPAARPDPISQILRKSAETPASSLQPSRTVFAVQRALVKLGYVLKADGIEGEATRKAIIQFETDHHLPAHGDLSAKLVRALRAESDIAIP
ncbi:peptidoglycan-binding domain-containing protein [uncultured Methylovirgula sp.]|uniref:peptidoglycan-binding domain-containing protein n=1 Tax=uncultured Methylovirgula sp. TaxID=1285960 RepID=UPI0026206F15|nr:peptidoglycan-binding domain-containing protein [uncultured Methylovirgula sp.]